MLGKPLATAVAVAFIAAAIAATVPAAAYGAPPAPQPVATTDDDGSYAPSLHSTPSLDGSLVASQCIGDVPWIGYSVVMTDPDNLATSHDPVLVISGSGHTTEIPLTTLDSSNKSKGKVLWPGASVDAAGNATGWPGWAFVDGKWVETDGNFAWTRGAITAVIRVNPEITVPLSYPPSTAACASPPVPHDPVEPAALAKTGSTFDPLPLVYAGGGLIVLGGLMVVLISRRAAKRR